MSLINWKPFSRSNNIIENDNWNLTSLASERKFVTNPTIKIYETDDRVMAELYAPEYEPKNIDVFIKDGVLRISGHTEEEDEDIAEDHWHRATRNTSFERVTRLPVNVREGEIKAYYDDGILKIEIPKS